MDNIDIVRLIIGKSAFQTSLIKQFDQRGTLSEKQWHWVNKFAEQENADKKLRGERKTAAAEAVSISDDLSGIFSLFETAKENLKFPKCYLETESEHPVKIQIAGEKSRYNGQLMITDGGPFGDNIFYGRISMTGEWLAARADQAKQLEVVALLKKLNEDPSKMAAIFGKATGACSFCNRELTDNKSITVGYGPVCATNFGLPWGAKAAKAKGPKTKKIKEVVDSKYDYFTLENKGDNNFVAYGWGTYGDSSVLAGQSKKSFITSFDTMAEAEAAYPEANWSNKWVEPQNTFNHLSDGPDY
jgi:hypothetical protein